VNNVALRRHKNSQVGSIQCNRMLTDNIMIIVLVRINGIEVFVTLVSEIAKKIVIGQNSSLGFFYLMH
jgi:hypothetical protein